MATAMRSTQGCVIWAYKVATGQAAYEGQGVLLASDETVQTAGVGSDLCIGIPLHAAAAGEEVSVQLSGLVAVKVGSGGATRGAKSVILADGKFQDAPAHDSSGGTDNAIYGYFLQSGVNGDLVGMMFIPSNRGSA